jgi:hypothetical protein
MNRGVTPTPGGQPGEQRRSLVSEENSGQQAENSQQANGQAEEPEFKAITSQKELDRLIGARLNAVKSQFADYDDLKSKAGQLDALSEASQTEQEKATSRATKAETERDDARAEALRLRVAVEHGMTLEDADLFLTCKDEETLTAQAKRLVDREADRKKNGPLARREGQTISRPAEDDDRAFARQLLGGD